MITERKFIPGTEWLYLKIYTGVKTADLILEEAVQPLTEYFQQNNSISTWFFIRYHDPKPHLRLRFKLNGSEDYSKVLAQINHALQEFVASGEISNIQMDTYNREIERYGENTIENAEILFCKNSEFTLRCLHYDEEEKIMVSLFYIHEILNKLHLSVQEKLNWARDFNDAFKNEFKADKSLNSQLDKKYRQFKPRFLDFMQSGEFSDERNAILSNIEASETDVQNISFHHEKQSLGMSLQSFFQSLFHMNINRLFISDQRIFEMIIYDYLLRYYKSTVFYNAENIL